MESFPPVDETLILYAEHSVVVVISLYMITYILLVMLWKEYYTLK